MSKSNIIVRVRYKTDVNFQRLVGGWCKYVSKDGADGKSLKDFSSTDELLKKEFGIFDSTEDTDTHYIWGKDGDITKKDILRDLPNDESGKMWTLVISFPPKFAKKSGLRTKKDFYMLSKAVLPKFILDNDMDLTNTNWYASYHDDTKNPHLHICLFEKEQRRTKNVLEKTSIKYLKSNIASYLIDNTSFYQEQDYLFLGLDYKVRNSNFTKVEQDIFFSNKFRKSLNKDLLELYKKLPKKGRLQYNAKNLNYCREDINKVIEKILYHDTIKYDFQKYYHYLEKIEREQKKIYGNSKNNNYIENKMKRLYSRIGNDILHNYKVYRSQDFLLHHKEFLKVNILNMDFRSRNIKKTSTILKHATELYKLGKLAELNDSDMRKLINKWLKNSKINYDVDLVIESIKNTNEEIDITGFYKSLSHLGYTKERYDNLKDKSFYKNIKFKQFVKKANYYLLRQTQIEERHLQEIIEKELQGKEI